jgi:hypothetical protein
MKEELILITNFLDRIPRNLRMVYERTDFLDLIEKQNGYNIDGKPTSMKNLFLDAANSAFKKSDNVVQLMSNILKQDKEIERIYLMLENVGLTKSSLAIKGSVFTDLWEKLEQLITKGITTFTQFELTEKFANALSFLSDFLGSLKIVFTDLEEIKEFSELIQGLLNLL